jgi:hypothetical protein
LRSSGRACGHFIPAPGRKVECSYSWRCSARISYAIGQFRFRIRHLSGFPDSIFTGKAQVNARISRHQPTSACPESHLVLALMPPRPWSTACSLRSRESRLDPFSPPMEARWRFSVPEAPVRFHRQNTTPSVSFAAGFCEIPGRAGRPWNAGVPGRGRRDGQARRSRRGPSVAGNAAGVARVGKRGLRSSKAIQTRDASPTHDFAQPPGRSRALRPLSSVLEQRIVGIHGPDSWRIPRLGYIRNDC